MTKRILVCEDEDAIREFVDINLKRTPPARRPCGSTRSGGGNSALPCWIS